MDLADPPVERSSLVSAVAWFGIIGGALGTLSGLGAMVAAPSVTSLGLLIGAVTTLYSSIGLRARREWARVGFMFVLAVSGLAGVVGAFRFPTRGMEMRALDANRIAPEQLEEMARQARPIIIGMAILGAIMNALLIAYLSTQRVRREFDA